MSKCMIFETLNDVKSLSRENKNGLMTLSGIFGVCGVRNNNGRVYEKTNYGAMVTEMQKRIQEHGAIAGELEHPQTLNINLENISHKITSIEIDEEGVVRGTIQLLNTPKGKIAQAIVEGGLPLFISTRATGEVDKTGNVRLNYIACADLVGSPGFSQAKMHLNESQVCESLSDNIFIIRENDAESVTVNENQNNQDNMDKEIMEKLASLEARIQALENENEDLQDQLEEALSGQLDLKKIADGVQNWIIEQYSPQVEKWIKEDFSAHLTKQVVYENKKVFVQEIAPKIQQWVVENYSAEVEKWICEQYSPQVEKWVVENVAPGVQSWMIEHFAPEIENWMNESYTSNIQDMIKEGLRDSKAGQLKSITDTLTMLEGLQIQKPTYGGRQINEGLEEPLFIANMPESARVQWNMASQEVKESIQRRAKLYDFNTEGAIGRFWESIKFEDVKPAASVYEGLESITDARERAIRAGFRRRRQNI